MSKLSNRFFKAAGKIKNMDDPATHLSYSEFLSFFRQKKVLTIHDVVIGVYFAYGWMPTIPNIHGDLKSVIKIANKVKTSGSITDEELQALVSVVNNSTVGVSKFLHFINPVDHAIWDSRVYRYLHQKEPYSYRLNKPGIYSEYLKCLDDLAADDRFSGAKKVVEEVVGYQVTDKRAAELIMYCNGKP